MFKSRTQFSLPAGRRAPAPAPAPVTANLPPAVSTKTRAASTKQTAVAPQKQQAETYKSLNLDFRISEKPTEMSEQQIASAAFYARRMQAVEKQFNLTSSELSNQERVSTGMLCTDLLTGGGIPGGVMFQISGLEKGAKSTTCLTTLGSVLKTTVPVIEYWDAENALDPDYTQFVIRRALKSIFYGQDQRARLYQEAVLETFYGATRALLRLMPDKLYRHEANQWYYVFNADQAGRRSMAEMGFKSYDKTMFQTTGRLWCPTDQTGMQAMIFVDSYPALVTEAQDEDDDRNNQMALDAKAFSGNIKRVRGLLKNKATSILGVNQIRLRPGTMHGNPEYEPGGNALAFYSDIRLQNKPRSVASVPGSWSPGRTADGKSTNDFGMERSVIDPNGFDFYNYIHIKNTKNKTSLPGLQVWMRTWFSDHQNNPHGWCPVFDTYQYLLLTGRAIKTRGGYQFNHPEIPNTAMTWEQFKLFIFAEVFSNNRIIRQLAESKLGLTKVPRLRAKLFAEMKNTPVRDLIQRKMKGGDDSEMQMIDDS